MLATNLPEQATSTANGITLIITLQRPLNDDATILWLSLCCTSNLNTFDTDDISEIKWHNQMADN